MDRNTAMAIRMLMILLSLKMEYTDTAGMAVDETP